MKGGKGKPPSDGEDDEIGYGKPPRRTRFKPGQSGNPKGRPRRALGKLRRLVEAMDQPTRDMFMAEMYRPTRITSEGKVTKVPAIQMVVGAMKKSAAQGGQQAQRTLIMLQLDLERRAAADNAEWVRLAGEIKERGYQILAHCRARGLPPPEFLPHPDDVYIDVERFRAEFRGPWTDEQKAQWDKVLAERDGYQRGVTLLQEEALTRPRDYTLPMLAVMAQERFDVINDLLPDRYRKPLENRMTTAQVDAARTKARTGFAAQKRTRARRRRARAALSRAPSE